MSWEIEQEKRKLHQDMLVTESKKKMFIDEIKNGLGEQIKIEPTTKPKKLSFIEKLKKLFS